MPKSAKATVIMAAKAQIEHYPNFDEYAQNESENNQNYSANRIENSIAGNPNILYSDFYKNICR